MEPSEQTLYGSLPTRLADLLSLDYSDVLAAVPSGWEDLELGDSAQSAGIWGHRTDGGFIDCIFQINFDEFASLSLTLAEPKFDWQGHHLEVSMGSETWRASAASISSKVLLRDLVSAFSRTIKEFQRLWETCNHCGDAQPAVYIQEAGVCMGCAPSVLGIIY